MNYNLKNDTEMSSIVQLSMQIGSSQTNVERGKYIDPFFIGDIYTAISNGYKVDVLLNSANFPSWSLTIKNCTIIIPENYKYGDIYYLQVEVASINEHKNHIIHLPVQCIVNNEYTASKYYLHYNKDENNYMRVIFNNG